MHTIIIINECMLNMNNESKNNISDGVAFQATATTAAGSSSQNSYEHRTSQIRI